jgi:pyruvate/2-oxoglutarate dehydrogenase complex dihydrolipoamide dehydrogenase (E3) component
VEVDSVIVAIGQAPDPSFVEGVVTAGGAFSVDPETMATNVPGIFAAGDAVKAPGTIVEAIAHGHGVAQSIDRFLKGKDLKRRRRQAPKEVIEIEEDAVPSFLAKRDRWDMPALSQKDAVRSFEETELGYSAWQAVAEARRCMNCRMCGNCVFGRGQICLETSSRLLAVN